MYSKESRQTDPLQDLFSDVKKILDFMEIKDQKAAIDNESSESKDLAEMWVMAKTEQDTYLTYRQYWTVSMFQEILPNVKIKNVHYWINNPYNVPLDFRDNLLNRGREAFLNSYEEKNNYYRMLNGLPPYGTPPSEFIYLSEPMRNQLHASTDPIHLLSPLIQNNFMGTDEYKSIIEANPDKKYLKYIGMYKIDMFTARRAKDFEIIRYPLDRSDINPNLINVFASLYSDYREYVMTTLYNEQLENLYVNYRTFMGVLITSFTLMQISNKGLEYANARKFLDDSAIHTILSMYGIPDELLMTNEVRRNLVINLPRLVLNKGMNEVYYQLVDILGYNDINFSKLLMMKGQQFDKNNNFKAEESSKPYFIQVDLSDKNPYETISNGNAPIYSYKDIISDDPTWWDLPDTQKILKESNYTVSDSKYIMMEAVIHQIKYLFESIYFPRLILDNKEYTDTFFIEIPEIFGTQTVSIYDLMVFIISATCMNSGMSGQIISDESGLFATAGFNFDMDFDSFTDYINKSKYLDKDRIMSFVEDLTVKVPSDINRLFNDVMYPMREWIERKIAGAETRQEYIEYENIYRAMFTYDLNKNPFLSDFELPIETIRKKYGISEDEMNAFKHFYPHMMTGETITIDQYNSTNNTSRYKYPFLSRNLPVDWWIHITIDTPYGVDDRGYVYFYDILNHTDLRELSNSDGTRVFMDYEDGEIGWQINIQAVNKAIELIDKLDEDMLNSAYFQIVTPIRNSNGKQFNENEKLPASIRNGVFKNILKEKLLMDMQGLAVPPKTYLEYLHRKNNKLYNLLTKDNRFERDKESWLNDILSIILAVETELSIHMKYLEQSVVGPDLFFKPLITLINRFKSTMINLSKVSMRHVFGDKADAGGNSNMFKLFDEIGFTIRFTMFAKKGHDASFGLYDTEHCAKHSIVLKDRSEMFKRTIGYGFAAETRTTKMGSISMSDEVKFFKNGEPVDPDGQHSSWYSGDPGTGRWDQEDDILMRTRKGTVNVTNIPIDFEGWKDYVESYNLI